MTGYIWLYDIEPWLNREHEHGWWYLGGWEYITSKRKT
jgi:hypothetical protein